jgi:predicted TPR repeat methyltransferase
MNHNIAESMDLTAFSPESLQLQVAPYLQQGWLRYNDMEESVFSTESGISIITYTQTLVRYSSTLNNQDNDH